MDEKKYQWVLPSREQMEEALREHLEDNRRWQEEVQRRYGKKKLHSSDMVAEEYAEYGNP